ncbi:hypothetical protein BC629DRAFT_1442134 [Irpex lacteus]|nr:hypothetical protein BC629DRAFT_1442134 [Irpex lacteus]
MERDGSRTLPDIKVPTSTSNPRGWYIPTLLVCLKVVAEGITVAKERVPFHDARRERVSFGLLRLLYWAKERAPCRDGEPRGVDDLQNLSVAGTGTLGYPVERDTHCQMSQPIMVPWYNLDVAGALSHQWYSASTWHQVNAFFAITGIHRLLEEVCEKYFDNGRTTLVIPDEDGGEGELVES